MLIQVLEVLHLQIIKHCLCGKLMGLLLPQPWMLKNNSSHITSLHFQLTNCAHGSPTPPFKFVILQRFSRGPPHSPASAYLDALDRWQT